MGIFRRNKQNTQFNLELPGGLFLERPRDARKQNPLFGCLPKGIFCFLIVFGSLGGFLSAFEMECNYLIPAAILFLSAMYFSGLFAFRKSYHKDLGYVLYFIFYVMAVFMLKSYVNSGFSAILNVVRQRGEVYFGLNTGTEFAERIDDRYLTVTIAFIFIGVFEIILLNIFVSNYMSLKFAVFMGMSLYVFPVYLREEPDLFFVLCMLSGFMGIYAFKNSGHFKDSGRRLGYEKEKKSKGIEIAYTQNSKIYVGILLAALCCTLFVGIGSAFYDEVDFRADYTENRHKISTGEAVAGFLMMGFLSFNRNAYSRGGMSGGKLGDISAIRPDNETDLVVRFAPYNGDPVYLKAFTGMIYENNEWLDWRVWSGVRAGGESYFYVDSTVDEAKQLAQAFETDPDHQGRAVMEVENVGAAPQYVYYPYFTLFDDDTEYTGYVTGSRIGGINRFTFYPNSRGKAKVKVPVPEFSEDVPIQNRDAVDRFIAAAGVRAEDADPVGKVVSYLKEEYSYSYHPGRLPRGGDVVNYFLDDNKKGVCYHFASAAVLIFRRLGIPARYVEGYAFGYNTMREGSVRDDLNYEYDYSGYSELGKTAVMEVNVTDANAHAWVEIYQEGRGWIVVDPTPSVMEDSAGDDFWSSLSNFWQNAPDLRLTGDISDFNLSFLNSSGMRLALAVLLGVAVFLVAGWFGVRKLLRWRSWHTADLRRNLLWYYRDVCRQKSRRDEEFRKLSMPSEQIVYLLRNYRPRLGGKEEEMDPSRVIHCLEEICFCPAEPELGNYKYVLRVLKRVRRRM